MNRRNFIGSLIAAVASLVGVRKAAAANGFVGAYQTPQVSFRGIASGIALPPVRCSKVLRISVPHLVGENRYGVTETGSYEVFDTDPETRKASQEMLKLYANAHHLHYDYRRESFEWWSSLTDGKCGWRARYVTK